jgi:carbon storage regulator
MLVLSRKPGEKLIISDNIIVSVVAVDGQRVKLAFEAPPEVPILRAELAHRMHRSTSADTDPDPDLAAKPVEWLDEPGALFAPAQTPLGVPSQEALRNRSARPSTR